MGRGKRILPDKLPEKLAQIRSALNYNLEEMTNELQKHVRSELKIYRNHILEFENGKREPQLPILLAYARLSNVYVDHLLDDELQLPDVLPAKKK